jgi:hypothetical protein
MGIGVVDLSEGFKIRKAELANFVFGTSQCLCEDNAKSINCFINEDLCLLEVFTEWLWRWPVA